MYAIRSYYAPHQPNLAISLIAWRRQRHQFGMFQDTRTDGHLWQEGSPPTGGHHLHQGIETGGGKRIDLASIGQMTGAQGMPGQTVFPLQQKDAVLLV